MVLKKLPAYLVMISKLPLSSKYFAFGYRKSRGLARPFAPIGPRFGKTNGAPKFSFM